MERQLEREFSQDNVRVWLSKYYGIINETFLKYVYDGYTFKGNYRAIRKPKTRKKIALDFHEEGLSKLYAQKLVEKLIKRDRRCLC